MNQFIEEIRINNHYTNYLVSEALSDPKNRDTETEPVYTKRTIFTNDFSKKLFQRMEQSNYILPPNIRYMEALETGSLIIVEEPPAIRTIFVRYDINADLRRANTKKTIDLYDPDKEYRNHKTLCESEYHRFTLAIPYVVHILCFGVSHNFLGGSVFFRKGQIRGFADELFKAPLNNINDGQNVCYGSGYDFGSKSSLNLAVDNVLNSWWSAVFNTDYTYNYNEYISKGIEGLTSYMEWQYYSKQNPLFIYDIPWIKYERKISSQIERMRGFFHSPREERDALKNFIRVLSAPTSTGKTVKIGKRVKRDKQLANDICQSTMQVDLKRQEYALEVGHQFKNNKGDHLTIDCFNGIVNTSMIKSIQIDRNGKSETWKATKEVWDYIINIHRDVNFEAKVTLDGVEVKSGDIISLTDPIYKGITYRRVGLIRKSRDRDGYEVQLAGNYYYDDRLKNISIMSIDNPVYQGIPLKVGEKYITTITEGGQTNAIVRSFAVTFRTVDVSTSGQVIFAFRDSKGQNVNILSDNRGAELFYEKDITPITTFPFYCGFALYIPRTSGPTKPQEFVFKENGRILIDTNLPFRRMQKSEGPSWTNDLLKKDKFFISGPVDQEYKIGETVICVDFRDPVETLRVKDITSFIRNKETGNIDFVLKDKDGKVTTHKYIDGTRGTIHTGSIRKIVSNINGVYSGTKIVAKESGRSCFPKKATNIIIGFITDTGGEPMVLCSNCATLWFSDLENFELYEMGSERWKTLEHAPIEMSKIRPQSGDTLLGDGVYTGDNHYYLSFLEGYSRFRFIPENYVNVMGLYADSYAYDKYTEQHTLFSTLPAPRIQKNESTFPGIPNMFGLVHERPSSPFKFTEGIRRI